MAYLEEVMNDYRNSLRDLHFNSKPLINMLTMLAEENEQHAPHIVKVIEDEILKVDEKTRASMYKLRQTWTSLFPNAKLYSIDVKIQGNLDPAWPITATPPEQTSIHVNPKFLTKNETEPFPEPEPEMSPEPTPLDSPKEEEDSLEEQEAVMRQQLIAKQQELLKLQQARLELELAEAQEKLQKQKKKNAGRPSSTDEPELPDTTVPPTSLEAVPPPRDPRLAGRDPRTKDPRMKDSLPPTSHVSSLAPNSSTPGGLQPPYEPPVSGLVPPLSGVSVVPPISGIGSPPPFMQSGQLHVNPGFLPGHHVPTATEGHFRGEVYHPDSSGDSEARSHDSDSGSSGKVIVQPKEPSTNQRDPRQARKLMEHRSRNSDNSDYRIDRESDRNSRVKENALNRNSNHDRSSSKNSNRNSKDHDRDSRRSHSPHSSSHSPRSGDSAKDSRSGSKTRDPRLNRSNEESRKERGKSEPVHSKRHEDRISPNSHNSPSKHKNSPSKRDDKRPSSSERSPKYSKTSEKADNKSEKDKHNKNDDRKISQKDKLMKRSSKERSTSPSKEKIKTKDENAKNSGSIDRMEKGGKDTKVRTPKRELEKDESEAINENESSSKKPRIETSNEKPVIAEGADVLGKIQEDISELFGGEDQDYRSADQKALPLKSPSCKGWDKFKADHPDQYAYDIELKKQRTESMDVDQRSHEVLQDTDYRVQRQPSWSGQSNDDSRRESTDEVSIPVELSMEHHAEILIQAHKHLQEGKLTHDQHQLLLQQLGELMKIQKLQEDNRRRSLESEGVQTQPTEDEDIRELPAVKSDIPVDRDLRKSSVEDLQRLSPNIESTPSGPAVNKPPDARENISPDKLSSEGFRSEKFSKEGSPHKHVHKGVPEFERQGPLHNLYPEVPRGPLLGRRPPFAPHSNLPPDHPEYRGPPQGPRPPFISRDLDRAPARDPNHPDFREHPPREGRDALPYGDMIGRPEDNTRRKPEQDGREGSEFSDRHPDYAERPPLEPYFKDERVKPFDAPWKDVGPFDRGDIGDNAAKNFASGDKRDSGPPGRHDMGLPPHDLEMDTPDRRDFAGRPGPHEGEDMGPNRKGHAPDFASPPDRRDFRRYDRMDHGPPDKMDGGFPDRRDGPLDRRYRGPPDRMKHRSPGEMDMGPSGMKDDESPGRYRMGHPGDARPDRMDIPNDRRDFEFHGRREGPPGEREFWGPPDRMEYGPPDTEFDRRDGPHRGRGVGPPGRIDLGLGPHDRDGPPGRSPDWRDHGSFDGDHGTQARRGPNWRDGPPDRMGMGPPDFRPDGPPDRRDLGCPDRMDMGPSDRIGRGPPDWIGMGPDRRDLETLDRRNHERFQGRRDFRSPDREAVRPPDFIEEPRDRVGLDRREQRHLAGPFDRIDRSPDKKDWGPRDGLDVEPSEFKGHRTPDRRGHGPPDRMIPETSDRRDHGPLDRTGPHDNREGPPDWKDRSPDWRDHRHPGRRDRLPDRKDGHPDRRSHSGSGSTDFNEIGPDDRKESLWPLGGRERPFNPSIAELEMVPERRTPTVDGPGENRESEITEAKPPEEVLENGERRGPRDDDKTANSGAKGNKKDHVEKGAKGRGPLLPTPPAHTKKESDAKQDEAEPDFSTNSAKEKKHIPALLELVVKPTGDLSKKRGKKEIDDVDPNTGLGQWEPVEKVSEKPHRKSDKNKNKKKRGHKAEVSDGGPPDRQEDPKHKGPHGKDSDWREGRRPPNRRDGLPVGADRDHQDRKRPHNRRDGPLKDRDMEHRPPDRRDGPDMAPEDQDGFRRGGPPMMMGPGMEGMRPPGRWEGPPVGPEDQRPSFPPGPRGPLPHGPMVNGPRGPPPGGPEMIVSGMEEDQRWTSFTDMSPEVSEEVVIGNKNYAIKLGDRPRIVRFFNEKIEVYADPSKRGIVVDGNLLYKFGERVKEVEIRGRTTRIFYHGKPVNLWIDGQNYEVRVDAPPRNIEINGNNHKIQIDGRDMMILIDKSEKGPYGGPPRFIYIDEDRMELRFDPPPRHILIDGKLCELMLNMKRPCVNIEGKLHGIRFDGPPRDIVINGQVFHVHTDRAVKVKVDNKLHYIALGGPCHEVIIDGKWFEMKFGEPPKEINVGNRILAVHLPGKPPEVKILPEILPARPGPPGMPMMGPGPIRPMGPSMEPLMRPPGPLGPNQRPLGPVLPNERPPFPIAPRPEMVPVRPEVSQPSGFPVNQPPVSAAQPMVPPFTASDGQMRPDVPQPLNSMGLPAVSTSGMPGALSGLFGNLPQPSLTPFPTPTPAPPVMDINTLLSKLIATGIIKKDPEPSSNVPPAAGITTAAMDGGVKKEESKGVKPVDLMQIRKKGVVKQESLEDIPDMTDLEISQMKELPNGVIQRLYAGIQCMTCGVRFVIDDEEKTEKYREHLDWHFRQNRRERDEMKVARYRQWYYGVNDWIQYEEITDTEETSRSMFFEKQQQVVQPTSTPTPHNMSFALITVPEGATVTRCPAATGNDADDLCAICHEPFEQFWDEELEEWHLRDAIRVNDHTYHPICYEDHTDISEGTPSPSALPMVPPDFSARKTLSYDESSQDNVNTSFEGERQVVKTEPLVSDGTDAGDKVSAVADLITISDSPIKPVSHSTVESEPMDTTDSAIIKQEDNKTVEGKTVVGYEVTSIVKHEPAKEDDSSSLGETPSGTVLVKEIQSDDDSVEKPAEQEISDPVSTSQKISESAQNKVATATDTVAMVTDLPVVPGVPVSEVGSTEAVVGSPVVGSGGSTPVQDERSRSCTPVKDECPGTPVQDEPMIE